MSVAHPIAFADALANDEDQQARSSYFGLFVTPEIPELLLSVNGFGFLKEAYGSMSEVKIKEYMQVFVEPGALTAALNWYRAAFAPEGEDFFEEAIESYLLGILEPSFQCPISLHRSFDMRSCREAVG